MIDGVIIPDPWKQKNRLSISAGSYGHAQVYGMAWGHSGRTTSNILLGYRKDELKALALRRGWKHFGNC